MYLPDASAMLGGAPPNITKAVTALSAKHAHCLYQARCLLLETAGRSGALLHQGGVLLGNVVKIAHCMIDLGNAAALFFGR